MSEGRQQISCPPSCPGRVCFDFTDGCTSRSTVPAVPNNIQLTTVPNRGFWSLFLFLGSGSLGQNFHLGTKLHVSQNLNCFLPIASGARQQLWGALTQEISILHRNPPLLQSPWCRAALGVECGSSCCPPTAARDRHPLGLEVQHRPPRLNHLPGFTAWQVRLQDLGD